MNRATPAFFALLLVCSIPAMSLVAADSDASASSDPIDSLQQQTALQQAEPTPVENTTNRLGLDGEVRNEYAEYDPALETALASTDDKLGIDYEQHALIEREFNGATPAEREAMIEDAHARLNERTAALEQREQEVVRAHANGERTDAELLQTLMRNTDEATALADAFAELDERADAIPGYSLPTPLLAEQTVLDFHRTPIRENLAAAEEFSGVESEYQVQIRTTQSGYSLSMIDGSTYLVETTRFDYRDTDAPDQFANLSSSETHDRATEFYSWASEHGSSHFQDNSAEQLYWTRIDPDPGYVEMYLDGGTGEVHREVQSLALSDLPVTDQQNWSDDGVAVSLNETPAGGPVEVTVADAMTEEPETATILVDGVEVGETGDDGSVWFVPPTSEYELTVETSSATLNTAVASEDSVTNTSS